MKKLFSFMLAAFLILSLVGCSNTTPQESNSLQEKEQEQPNDTEVDKQAYEYEQAQKAYAELNKAANLCEYAMDVVYGAWYFAIYEAEMGVSNYKNYDGFEARTGLKYSEIETAMQSLGLSYDKSFYLTEISYAVKIAQLCLTNKNVYADAQSCIDNAKAYLKEVTNKYADYTAYPTLKL